MVGIPDAKWARLVAAFVRLAPGAQLDPAALVTHCRERIAAAEDPGTLGRGEEWPLTGSGKIRSFALRDRFVAGEWAEC